MNLKKKPGVAKAGELWHKEHAIETAANAFYGVCPAEPNRAKLMAATLVPIPPSAIRSDPRHDDRMLRLLQQMGAGLNLDIRELVKQHRSVAPAHECELRPTVAEIAENYYIDEELAEPEPAAFWIFDDVLTAGSHFKAMQIVLQRTFIGVPTAGFFVARRVPETVDPENLLSWFSEGGT